MKPRPQYVPHQSRISVMDVHNTNTNAGIAMENEEMRRIRISIENEMKELLPKASDAAVGAVMQRLGTPDGGGDKDPDIIKKGIWALTTKHNSKIIVEKVNQSLDFIDKGKFHPKYELGVNWKLERDSLEDNLKTIQSALETNIKAWAYSSPQQFLEWLDLCLRPIMSVTGWASDTPYYNYFLSLVNDEWNPGNNKYYGTGPTGLKGFHSLPAFDSYCIEKYFSYADISGNTELLINTVPEKYIIEHAEIEILEDFDDNIKFKIGDTIHARIMNTSDTFAKAANKYAVHSDYVYLSDTDLYLRWNYDSTGPTKGQGRILIYLEYVKQ